jgi:hypothetical protein
MICKNRVADVAEMEGKMMDAVIYKRQNKIKLIKFVTV